MHGRGEFKQPFVPEDVHGAPGGSSNGSSSDSIGRRPPWRTYGTSGWPRHGRDGNCTQTRRIDDREGCRRGREQTLLDVQLAAISSSR
jgi:hypothetical protein